MLSQFRLSSVCLSSVTLVHPTQPVEILGNFSSPYDSPGTLVFCCHGREKWGAAGAAAPQIMIEGAEYAFCPPPNLSCLSGLTSLSIIYIYLNMINIHLNR